MRWKEHASNGAVGDPACSYCSLRANSAMSKRATIFLDIDGVLHPNFVGDLEYGLNGPVVVGQAVCSLQTKLAERVSGKAVDIAIHSMRIYMFDLKRLQDEYLRALGAATKIYLTNRRSESRSLRIGAAT